MSTSSSRPGYGALIASGIPCRSWRRSRRRGSRLFSARRSREITSCGRLGSAFVPRSVANLLAIAVVVTTACTFLRPPTTEPASPLPQWRGLHAQYVERASRGSIDVLFLGDSITMQWSRSPLWASQLAPLGADNFGVDGDGTRQVLWRIENGELNGISPKVVVLLIGVNDLIDGDSPQAVRDGTLALVREISARLPKTTILSLAIFPVGRTPRDDRTKVASTNALVSAALPSNVRRL